MSTKNPPVSAGNELYQGINFLIESRTLLVGLLLLVAFLVRLPGNNQPPLDFHATRQYRAFILARSMYFESRPGIPEWRRNIAHLNAERQGILEPPVMEFIVAKVYLLAGDERFWIPKVLASLFWMLGGIFLYRIAARMTGPAGALFSTAFYLFLPFAVTASQSFQPDPLMILLILMSLWAILRYHEESSRSRLFLAAVLTACAILIKPVCLFMILGAFTALSIHRHGLKGSLNLRSFAFFAISFLPISTFYFWGIFLAGFLQTQADASFVPRLLLDPFFWRNWLNNIRLVIGFTFFVAALAGLLLIPRGLPRALMAGLWAGYVLFNLVFSYHVATHDYYQLQLVPLSALSLGPLFQLIWDQIQKASPPGFRRLSAWSILVLALLLCIGLILSRPVNPNLENKVRIARAIGEQVNHSPNTVFHSSDYGLPLQYHGELSGESWPILSDLEWERLAGVEVLDAEERFNRFYRQDRPDYFIVLDRAEFEGQGDLVAFLSGSFPAIVDNEDYIIFDLRSSPVQNELRRPAF